MKRLKMLMVLLFVAMCITVHDNSMCSAKENDADGFKTYTTKASFGDLYNDRYFMFHARNDTSSFVTLKNGTYMRVHDRFFSREIIVEYYDKRFNLTGTKKIPYELQQFNGFHTDGKYNYLIFSQRNPDKDDKRIVCTVIKYSSSWKQLKRCNISNTNIKKFMWCSGTAMLTDNGKLYIKTAREKYDGHQSTVNYVIRTSDMKLLEKRCGMSDDKYGYVSHSMAQYLAKDGHTIISAEHGDGSPRGVEIHDSGTRKNKVVLNCAGEWGQNYTGLQLGGLGVSGQAYITVGSTMDQGVKNVSDKDFPEYCRKTISNVFISVWDRNNDSTRTTYLTDYKDNEEMHIPYIVEINRNRFIVLWSHDERVYYVEIDGAGRSVTPINSVKAQMHVKPVINNGNIVWLSYDNDGNISFYSLPIDSIKVKLNTPESMRFEMRKGSIKVNWDSVPGADGYYLYRKHGKSSYKKIAQIKDGSTPAFIDKNVKDGEMYTYTVKAYRKQGNMVTSGMNREGWSYRFLAPVTVKKVTNKKDYINITWEDKKSETGYYLYRENDGVLKRIATLGTNKTSYKDEKVMAYQQYKYYVVQRGENGIKSVRDKGKSIYYLDVPDKAAIKVKDGYLSVAVYPLQGEDTFLYRSVNGGTYKKLANVKKKSYIDRAVSNGNIYRYKIAVKYKGSYSYASDVTKVEYLDKVKITNVYNYKEYVKLCWTINKKATKYYIYRKDGKYSSYKKIATVNGGKNISYSDKNIIHGMEVEYMVKAVSGEGISADSNRRSIKHLNEPVVKSAKVTDGNVKVDIVIDNECDVELYRKTNGSKYIKVKHFTGDYQYSYLDSNVKSGEIYTYIAVAVEGRQKSSMVRKGVSVTYVASINTLNAVMDGDKIKLSWDKVKGAFNYKVYNMDSELIAETSDNMYEVTLKENVDYKFSVAAEGNDYITKKVENEKVFYYLPSPQILSVVQKEDKAYISLEVSQYYSDISLYRSSGSEYEKQAVQMNDEKVFETVIPGDGEKYKYKIIATDKYGKMKEAVSDICVSYIGVVAMSSVQYDNSKDVIKVQWNESDENVSGYVLFRSVNGGEYTEIARIDSADNTVYEDTDVSENNNYSYKVSVSGFVQGTMSEGLSIFIPKSPDNVKVLREGNSFNISWNQVDDCQEYIIHIKYPDGTTYDIHETSTSYKAGVMHGITEFYVTSYVNGIESKAPGEKVKSGYVDNSKMLSLELIDGGYELSYDEIQGVDGYALYRYDGEKEELVSYIDKECLKYDDTGLTSGKYYEYRLCGYIQDGDTRYVSDGIKYRKMLFIGKPQIKSLKSLRGKVYIDWIPVDGAVEYTLCRREGGKNWTAYKGGIKGNTYIDTDVKSGVEYEYALIGVAEKSESFTYFDWNKSIGNSIVADENLTTRNSYR